MAEYKLINPSLLHVKGMTPADICGLHSLLSKEGCVESENMFPDEDKAIALDGIQERIARQNHTDKLSSADILLVLSKSKYILADAKFRQENVKNLSLTELKKKLECSKSLVLSDEYTFGGAFYVLFKRRVLQPKQRRWLKQHMSASSPNYRFVDAVEFKELFE